jgi:gas vesicle protein
MGIFGDIAGAVIGGAASLFGGKQQNDSNQQINQSNNAFNAEEAQKNRDWQEQMRKTQYQTAIGDLKAAGLNPMLAYSQGGAGTPGGSTASAASSPHMENVYGTAANAAQTAVQGLADLKIKEAQANNLTTQSFLNTVNAAKATAEEIETHARTRKWGQETETSKGLLDTYKKQLGALDAQIDMYHSQSRLNSANAGKTLIDAANNKAINPNASSGGKLTDYLLDKGKGLENKARAVSNKYIHNQ